jgi:hypothetical protein
MYSVCVCAWRYWLCLSCCHITLNFPMLCVRILMFLRLWLSETDAMHSGRYIMMFWLTCFLHLQGTTSTLIVAGNSGLFLNIGILEPMYWNTQCHELGDCCLRTHCCEDCKHCLNVCSCSSLQHTMCLCARVLSVECQFTKQTSLKPKESFCS